MAVDQIETKDKWAKLLPEEKTPEKVEGKATTNWEDAWLRFKGNKVALFGVFLIVIIVLSSLIGPFFTGYDYSTQDVYMRNIGPFYEVTLLPDGTAVYVHSELKVYLLDEDYKLVSYIDKTKDDLINKTYTYTINDNIYYLRFGTEVTFETEDGTLLEPSAWTWNTLNLLGTDTLGRDMLTRLLYGGRISLLVASITTLGILLIGIVYGGISGYYGGNVDILMMRFVEIISAIPSTIYIILLMVVLGQGIMNILIAMAITSWLGMATMVRAQVLSLKERDFVMASKIMGVSPLKIVLTHLIPNCLGPIIITATLAIPGAISTEAFMSFIGLGVAPPMPSWGMLSSDGIEVIRSSPYQIVLPSIFISLTMFGFNFLGDGLRDSLDPKQLT